MKIKRRYIRPAIQVVEMNCNGVLLTSASLGGYVPVDPGDPTNGWTDE